MHRNTVGDRQRATKASRDHAASTDPTIEYDSSHLDLDIASPPFDYNTSSWSQRVPIAILCFTGFVIAGYMGLYQWGFIESVWDPVFGSQSEQVLRSETSLWMERWMLVPDAVLGALAYLGDAIYGLAGSTRRWQMRPWMTIPSGSIAP